MNININTGFSDEILESQISRALSQNNTPAIHYQLIQAERQIRVLERIAEGIENLDNTLSSLETQLRALDGNACSIVHL